MGKFSAKLLIGEKIGFGFGFVGLLFLLVIWQYHLTLQNSLRDYQQLLDVFEAKKSHALAIQSGILGAEVADMAFLIQRDKALAAETEQRIDQVFRSIEQLRQIDSESAITANQIADLARLYQQDFRAVAKAWEIKGLTHDLGLQGAFRDTVHELEAMAGQHKVGALYLQLLQIRRGEKDLGLRREEQYLTKVLQLIQEFQEKIFATELDETVKERLLAEVNTYRDAFRVYAGTVLQDGDIKGGKGLFRQIAHRIEALLQQHYIPDLETTILQLRRREKDYLLRLDKRYVDMALQELAQLRRQLERSAVPEQQRSRFEALLANYQRDFLALVEQNDRIRILTDEMQETISEISVLTHNNVDQANQTMEQVVASINAGSSRKARLMLWIVVVASLLGVFLTLIITRHISRPLRKMAGMLDQLAYEEPTERMAVVSDGRDEVNAMAESVNTMADHRAKFIEWWKASMREADACQVIEQAVRNRAASELSVEDLEQAERELLAARENKQELAGRQYREIDNLCGTVIDQAEKLLAEKPGGETGIALDTIRHSAKSIRSFLDIVSFQGDRKKGET